MQTALLRSLTLARSRGITTVHDLGVGLSAGMQELAAYRALDTMGEMPVHTVGFLRGDLAIAELEERNIAFTGCTGPQGHASAWPAPNSGRMGPFKDCLQPCELRIPAARTITVICSIRRSNSTTWFSRCTAREVRSRCTPTGDAAVAAAIAALRSAHRSDGRRARHRIEHCQVSRPADLEAIRDAEIGVSFFVNPCFSLGRSSP